MMKKRILLLLSVVFMFSMTVLASTIFVSANTASTGDTLARFICDGDETALNKAESSAIGEGGILVYERTDGSAAELSFLKADDKQQIYATDMNGSGLPASKAGTKNVRLVSAEGYLVYEFDLEDSIAEVYFNIIGQGFKVEYSVDVENGYTAYTEIPSEDATSSEYLVRSYRLTATDALAKNTNAFRIKFTNPNAEGGGQACLYSFGIFDHSQEISGITYSSNNITAGISNVIGSNGKSLLYFDGEESKGYSYLKQNAEIAYRFSINSVNTPKPVLSLDVSRGTLAWEYSTNGTAYTAGTDLKSVTLAGATTIYVKVKNTGSEDMLFKGLSIKNDDTIAHGVNANTNIPANEAETYFKVGDVNEEMHMFGVTADYKAEFNSAHGGLVRDGHEGGWLDTMPENARKLTAGQYVAYDFDLKDAITSAKLKIHAGSNIKVLVSSDVGATVHILTTTNTPGGRGMYIFDLSEANALANANNKFRVVIQGVSESYLFALMVHEDIPETISRGTSLKPWSRDGLRYLIKTKNVHAYYGHGRYQNYFFNGENSYAIFKVVFDSTVTDPIFFVNQCGSVKVELSGDGVNYTSVISKLLDGTGDVPYNTFDAKSYLVENKTVYVKLTNVDNEGGFVHDAGFASASALASGTIEMDTLPNYLHSVSNKENIGTLKTTDANGEKGFLLEGDSSFKIKYEGEANGIKLSVSGIRGTGTLYISKNGTDFEMIGSLKEGSFSVIDYLSVKDNDDKVLYVKLSGADFVFDKIVYTTAGIEAEGDKSKPYDDDTTFDYDKTLPGVDSYGKPTLSLPETPESKLTFNKALVIGLSVGGGSVLLLGGGFAAIWFLVIKKKGGAK